MSSRARTSMSRLLPAAEATARFLDVQLSRTRSSRGQRSVIDPKAVLEQVRTFLVCMKRLKLRQAAI
jgi:hypothetical protein